MFGFWFFFPFHKLFPISWEYKFNPPENIFTFLFWIFSETSSNTRWNKTFQSGHHTSPYERDLQFKQQNRVLHRTTPKIIPDKWCGVWDVLCRAGSLTSMLLVGSSQPRAFCGSVFAVGDITTPGTGKITQLPGCLRCYC